MDGTDRVEVAVGCKIVADILVLDAGPVRIVVLRSDLDLSRGRRDGGAVDDAGRGMLSAAGAVAVGAAGVGPGAILADQHHETGRIGHHRGGIDSQSNQTARTVAAAVGGRRDPSFQPSPADRRCRAR